MTDRPLCPTAQKVLETLLAQPGVEQTPVEVCERIDCTLAQTRATLATLAQAGVIEGWEGADGSVTYIARPPAPQP
jgi:hypothetical protein